MQTCTTVPRCYATVIFNRYTVYTVEYLRGRKLCCICRQNMKVSNRKIYQFNFLFVKERQKCILKLSPF